MIIKFKHFANKKCKYGNVLRDDYKRLTSDWLAVTLVILSVFRWFHKVLGTWQRPSVRSCSALWLESAVLQLNHRVHRIYRHAIVGEILLGRRGPLIVERVHCHTLFHFFLFKTFIYQFPQSLIAFICFHLFASRDTVISQGFIYFVISATSA